MDLDALSAQGLVFEALAKSTIVLLLAFVGIETLARRRSAALRHALHCAALFAAAAVPLLALVLPLPRWHAGVLAVPAPGVASESDGPAGLAPGFTRATGEPYSPTSAIESAPASTSATIPLETLAIAAWITGSAIAAARVLRAAARAAAFARSAEPVVEPRPLAALRDAATALGVRRPVRLATSRNAATAVVAGIRRPAIVLPREFRDWPEASLRAALLHETAHVRRADCAENLATRLAASVLFFHPLARLAVARIDALREEACDDAALAAGARPTDYAAALLSAARDVRGAGFAIAMARPFPVERRIASVLDPARARRPLASRTPVRLGVTALGLALVTASLDPRSAAAIAAGFSSRGDAAQARWSDERFHVGAFLRGEADFDTAGAAAPRLAPGAFLLVAARDAATGEVHTLLATRDAAGGEGPRVVESPSWPSVARSVLPETARRLRSAGRAAPPGERGTSGSTLVGERAMTTDGEGQVLLARFESARGPAGVFASGPITLAEDGRSITSMGAGACLVAFSEADLPRIVTVVPGAGGAPAEQGAASRALLSEILPDARRHTESFAPAVWRSD